MPAVCISDLLSRLRFPLKAIEISSEQELLYALQIMYDTIYNSILNIRHAFCIVPSAAQIPNIMRVSS